MNGFFASLMAAGNKDQQNAATNEAFINKCWDHLPLADLRATKDERSRGVAKGHMGMGGMIQEGLLKDVAGNEERITSGLTARLATTFLDRSVRDHEGPINNQRCPQHLTDYWASLLEATHNRFREPLSEREQDAQWEYVIPCEPPAARLLERQSGIWKRRGETAEHRAHGTTVLKYAGLAARLAGLLAIANTPFDDSVGGRFTEQTVITEKQAADAIAIINVFDQHVEAVFGLADAGSSAPRDLYDWIVKHEAREFDLGEVSRTARNFKDKRQRLEYAVKQLERSAVLEVIAEKSAAPAACAVHPGIWEIDLGE